MEGLLVDVFVYIHNFVNIELTAKGCASSLRQLLSADASCQRCFSIGTFSRRYLGYPRLKMCTATGTTVWMSRSRISMAKPSSSQRTQVGCSERQSLCQIGLDLAQLVQLGLSNRQHACLALQVASHHPQRSTLISRLASHLPTCCARQQCQWSTTWTR
jgi:hypothetical protein